MNSFVFARHGKSQANKKSEVALLDSPLTKEGKAQARKLARSLKSQGITVVVTSPYSRAYDTAAIIAKELSLPEPEIIEELHERGLGDFEGKPKQHESEWYFTIDDQANVEPIPEVIARMQSALQKIVALPGKVLVIGHAMAGYYLQQVALGRYNI